MKELATVVLTLASVTAMAQAWKPDVYPISYWLGPPDAFLTDKMVGEIAELNFTVMGNLHTPSVERTRQVLDLAHKHGLKAIVCDRRIITNLPETEGWEGTIDAVVRDYADHPALYGYYLRDEPNRSDFPHLAAIEGAFTKRDPAHLPYINLFPTYASFEQLGTPSYRDHVEDFMTTVTPRALSYDHYALLKTGRDRPDYFENLEIIRDAALRHRVPFWNIIILAPHFGYRDPTEAELRWQIATSLAYGCKGIWYFTFWTHQAWALGEGKGAIYDPEGRKTHHFDQIKRLNHELKMLGRMLLQLTSVNVYHTPNVPQGARRLGGDAPVASAAGGDLLIGWLQDAKRRDYLMVVNKDYKSGCEATVALRGPVRGVHEVSGDTGAEMAVKLADTKPTVLGVSLAPGQGRLFRLDRDIPWASLLPVLRAFPIRFRDASDARAWQGLHSVTPPQVVQGALSFRVTGSDPYLHRSRLRIPADTCTMLVLRMRKEAGTGGQVFWTTATEPSFSDKRYMNYETVADGEFHDIRVPVGKHPGWTGTITAIRIDPDIEGTPGSVAIEAIAAAPADPRR